MKLEEGMYVRTKNGMKIGKIVKIHKAINHKSWYELKNGLRIYSYEEINEPNYSIIDLIEVGDYVNGFPVIHKENDILKCGLLVQFKENEIKSIVTKEQFESMSYKVGGND